MIDKTFIDIPQNASLEEKIAMLKHNNHVASNIRGEMATTKVYAKPVALKEDKKCGETSDLNKSQDSVIDEIYNKISLLSCTSKEELLTSMKNILSDTSNSIDLFDKLKLKLYEEIVLYVNLSYKENDAIKDIRDIIASLRLKIELLNNIEEQKEIKEISLEHNELLFLETNSLNVIALESIRKNIPIEYYNEFKILLENILNGTFKNLKRLKNGLYEVKAFKVRILFVVLKKGHYLILDAFMKKEDTSAYYKSLVDNRLSQYLNSKDYYLSCLDSEESILKHKNYLVNILDMLSLNNNEMGQRL